VAGSVPDGPRTIAVLLREEGEVFGLKIPEFGIELYGPDLPDLIEQAEEHLWWGLKRSGQPVPGAATLAIKWVTEDEFGPTCFERRAEEIDGLEDE
jgi:hypothetical protein